jgi:hypothetical protein
MKDDYDLSKITEKKRINSRTKGSSFERKIAKLFNDHFNTKEFSRSPGSGAFATTHTLPDHLQIYGDLITPQSFKFCIECKKGYNKENIYSLLDNSSVLWGFIKQCEKDSQKCNKLPLVLFQQDRRPIMAITWNNIFDAFIPHITIGIGIEYAIYKLEDLLASTGAKWS